MSTATHVPETSRFGQDELSADDARTTISHAGIGRLFADSFRMSGPSLTGSGK